MHARSHPSTTTFRAATRLARARAWLLAGALAAGCAAPPERAPLPPTQALVDVADTPLARMVAAATPPGQAQRSGLQLLVDGKDAWQTRLAMACKARKSLDAMYYQVADDASGRQFLQALLQAAKRGVRVRLLIDDLHAGESHDLFAALDAHANAEVRLFNPLPVRSGPALWRVLLSLHRFERINRRMHNKLFLADNQLALTGGRNIGDEYFMRGAAANFIDVDVLAAGNVVAQLSALFDAFWNDPLAYPLQAAQPRSDEHPGAAPPAAPCRGGAQGVAAQIESGHLELRFADVRVFADAPEKAANDGQSGAGKAMERALALMQAARSEVLIASPYFVPGPLGLALIRKATQQGIRVAVTTNSLAATDEPLAYRGYARYRVDLLKMGVRLAEIRPVAEHDAGPPRGSLARLHAKLAVVDRRWLLAGSMNMDLRSSRLNTELTLAIDSAALADEAAQLLERRWSGEQYRLRLAANGQQVEWLSDASDPVRVYAAEPQVNWLVRWRLSLASVFVAEELL